MAEVLLNISKLRVQYGRFLAVDDLSLALEGGHLLGMIGPNGAGKTTTIRAAAGLQPPTTGSITVMGYDVTRHPTQVGHHLGFAPDSPAAYDNLTVEQFLGFIGRCYSLAANVIRERIDHWLHTLWLTDKRTAKVGSLSRGMRQRLTVARTLLPDPHVVLLDEPAAGLDPAGRVQFRQLLASLRLQGKAIIVSSHILADLAEYCTHIAIMGHGKLLNFGTVAQVAGGAAHELITYRIELVRRIGDVEARLAEVPQAAGARIDGDVILIDASPEREQAAALLTRLLAAGLPVAEFHAMKPDLEQAYLRTGIGQVD